MPEFTLRENADRYLLEEITLKQLMEYVDEDIIEDFRYGERDLEESKLASALLCFFIEGNHVKEIHGHFDEEEFRMELAAYLYFKELTAAHRESAPAKAS